MQKKYSAPADTKILGATLVAVTENIKATVFAHLIDKHNLTKINSNKWYNLQEVLDFYKDLSENSYSAENMIAIGIRVFENIPFPPEVNSVEKAMHMLNQIQKMNMKNYPDEWDNKIEIISDTHVIIHERGPFPHDLLYGYFYGICKKLIEEGKNFTIKRKYVNGNSPDDGGAVYNIIWGET